MINMTKSCTAAALAPWTLMAPETSDQTCPQARLMQHLQPMTAAPCTSLLKWLLGGRMILSLSQRLCGTDTAFPSGSPSHPCLLDWFACCW